MDLPQLVVMTDHSKVTADKYPFIVGYDRDLTIEEAQEVVRRCELVSKLRNRLISGIEVINQCLNLVSTMGQ